jgi:hypothetical protein
MANFILPFENTFMNDLWGSSFKLANTRSSQPFSWPTRQETTASRQLQWGYQHLQIHTI